jgi:hypothetical protein
MQPGDAITSIFDQYPPTGECIDNWILEPGNARAAAGETPSSRRITNTFSFTGTLAQLCTSTSQIDSTLLDSYVKSFICD